MARKDRPAPPARAEQPAPEDLHGVISQGDPGLSPGSSPQQPAAADPQPPPPPAVVAVQFRVVKTKKFSLFGQIVTWRAGDVIEPAQWGSGALESIRAAGVELEPVN